MTLVSRLLLWPFPPTGIAWQQCQPAPRRRSCGAGRLAARRLSCPIRRQAQAPHSCGDVGNLCYRPLEHDSPESPPGTQRGFRFLDLSASNSGIANMSAQSLLAWSFASPSAAAQTVLEETY